MMKRKVSCVLAVLLVISLLSGCSVNTASGPVKSKTTTLTYWTFNGLHEALFQDAATKWNELHPDRKIKLNSVVYPYGQMHDNLSISLIANQGVPDLVDIEQKRFATMIKGKNVPLVDLTSWWRKTATSLWNHGLPCTARMENCTALVPM